MSIFSGCFGFLNFDLGGWRVQIRNQRLCKLPSTEFHLNQITSGILNRLIRSGGPSCPRGLLYPQRLALPSPTIDKIYDEVTERVLKTKKTFI